MRPRWLNRNVLGMTITSFCADAGYEMIIAVLPGFFTAIGAAAAALGWIEGAADALASFVMLGAGSAQACRVAGLGFRFGGCADGGGSGVDVVECAGLKSG